MFLVHYPIALWLQYWLFDYDLPAIVKAAIGFVLTVAFSWALTRGVAADSRRDEGAVNPFDFVGWVERSETHQSWR